MGRLVGLELYNFKSYKGKATIGFGSAFFTSIIGPNGAGKSNMMDAISFVLGVNSTHLRSQNLKDLIYRGRVANESFVDSGLASTDPTRAHVMIKYEKDSGETLELKRTINRNGTSEYKINEKTVTSLNYTTVLKGENILIKAKNFLVFQGDVEQIASQSPKGLTTLIETVSGSADHISEYERLKDEYEIAHEFTKSVFSRRRVLNSESRQYKEQMIEQRQFEDLLIQKSEIIKKINLYKVYHNEEKHKEILQELETKNKELKSQQKMLSQTEKEYSSIKLKYSKRSLAVKKEELSIEELARETESVRRELVPIEANKKMYESKVTSTTRKIDQLRLETIKQEQVVQKVAKELHTAEQMFRDFQEKIPAAKNSSLSSEAQNEYELLRDEYMTKGGAQLEEEIEIMFNDKSSVHSTIRNIKGRKQNALARISELEDELSVLKVNAADFESKVMDTLASKQEKVEARNAFIRKKEEIHHAEMQLNSQLRETLVIIDELSAKQRESNNQRKLRENIAMLKKLLPHKAIRGLVYELVRPTQLKYETALVAILGRNANAVIVETTAVARQCIDILKERRAGVATFIPLDSVVNDLVNWNYLRSIHEGAQPALDILEYDDISLEQAIQYVVGDALVVDNVESARTIKWESNKRIDNRIVALDGSVIHKSGLMTGGQQQEKPSSALTWDRNELNKQTETKEALMSKIFNLNEQRPKEIEITLLNDSINDLDSRLSPLRNSQKQVTRTIEERKNEIIFQNNAITELNNAIEEKELESLEFDRRIEDVKQKMCEIKSQVYGSFCLRFDLQNGIDDYETLHGETLRERAKERSQYARAISSFSNRLEFEKERLSAARNRNLEDILQSYQQKVMETEYDRNEKLSKIEAFQSKVEVLSDELKKSKEELEDMLKQSKAFESSKEEITSSTSELSKYAVSLEEYLLRIDMERVNLLKNCKIQNIDLPLKDGFLDSISIDDSSDKLLKIIYNIEVDYYLLDEQLKSNFKVRTEHELEAKLDAVIESLEKLAPNVKATERLQETEARIKGFDRDYSKARQAERKVAEKFQKVRAKRHELFMTAFNHISANIDSIYKELTKAPPTPLGGSAYLTLEDEDSPYTSGIKFHAMPPMKRFRDMDLLSGGEKTIAALALLFTVHSFQPSPFFVLDEVDAALDNSNVSKIANYIKKHAVMNFQFIVISLKNSLFEKSDALVGIYREQRENSSKTVTIDLRDYPEEESNNTSQIVAR